MPCCVVGIKLDEAASPHLLLATPCNLDDTCGSLVKQAAYRSRSVRRVCKLDGRDKGGTAGKADDAKIGRLELSLLLDSEPNLLKLHHLGTNTEPHTRVALASLTTLMSLPRTDHPRALQTLIDWLSKVGLIAQP